MDVKRPVEGAADAEVQHAAAQDEERALKAVLVEEVLDKDWKRTRIDEIPTCVNPTNSFYDSLKGFIT